MSWFQDRKANVYSGRDHSMPRSGYVMFAHSGANDQLSNLVSLFDIIEIINVFQSNATIQIPPFANLVQNRIVVAWLREDGDLDTDRFEGQIACLNPDGTDLFAMDAEPFSFTSPFFRWTAPIPPFGFNVLGTHQIEARLRRVGQQEWTCRQTFPFIVQAGALPPAVTTPVTDLPPE